MNPLTLTKLPRLSPTFEKFLIDKTSNYLEFDYNKNTSCENEQQAIAENDLDKIQLLNRVKAIYETNIIPQHRMKNLEYGTIRKLESYIGIKIPNTARVYVQVIDSENSLIHTDGLRKNSFFYLLSDNGECETRFYTSDKPTIHSRVWDPNDVTQIYSDKIKPHKWYMFSHDTIHSVNNVEGLRITLIIDMTESFENYTDFINNYKHII